MKYRVVCLEAIIAFFLATLAQAQIQGNAGIHGQILATPKFLAEPIEVVLRKGGKTVANTLADGSGNYEFRNLANGKYDVVAKSRGREARQSVELACGPDSTSFVVVVLDQLDTPRVAVYFPIEDPDVVDVAEARQEYPKDVVKEYERAREDSRNRNFSRAARRLETVVKRAPGFYNARARLGMVYQTLGCYADAEEQYVKARELSLRTAQPLINLANLHIQATDTGRDSDRHRREARNALELAIRIKPNSAIAYCLLGFVDYSAGVYEDAEKNLNRALEIQSRMAAAQLMLANVYMRQEKWQAALDKLDEYLEQHPTAPGRGQVRSERVRIAQRVE